ncbi:ArnT family glycosyltransferase [Chitinophagaceae bacterium MMS25-I14]
MTSVGLNNFDDSRKAKIFLVLSLFIIFIMTYLSKDYGQSGDEWLHIQYGEDIWNYFKHNDKQALNYENRGPQFVGQEYYGGLYDYSMHRLHLLFPNIPILSLRHFFNSLLGALMMVGTGLLTFRITKRNWNAAILALLFMFLSPRIFGESMNNPKDIPFASGFALGTYFLVAYLQDFPRRRWINLAGIALSFGLTFGVRPAGGLFWLVLCVFFSGCYWFFNRNAEPYLNKKTSINAGLFLGAALLAGALIGFMDWPWGLQAPVSNTLESLKAMTNRATTIRVLFEGEYMMNNEMPWYYEFKWICITTPIIILLGLVLFLVRFLKVKEAISWFGIVLLVTGAFFPLCYMIYKHSTVYDTWRHVFFVYPFWVSMSAAGWVYFANGFPKYRRAVLAVCAIGLLLPVYWMISEHPNQYVYFNELAGGEKGAYAKYDFDYYQNSGKQAANWIMANAKRPPEGKKIMVGSNMGGFDKYFSKDTSWIRSGYIRYNERDTKDWDYYVTYSRYISVTQLENETWPGSNAVHIIKAGGVPISAVLERKSKDDMYGFQALQRNSIDSAIVLFQHALAADSSNESTWLHYAYALAGKRDMAGAMNAAQRAAAIDPENEEVQYVISQLNGSGH